MNYPLSGGSPTASTVESMALVARPPYPILIASLLCFLLSSCGLSRNEAKAQIMKKVTTHYYFTNKGGQRIFLMQNSKGNWQNTWNDCSEIMFFNKLESEGFLSINQTNCGDRRSGDIWVSISDKLSYYRTIDKNWYGNNLNLVLGELSDIEIFLIKENSATSRTVEYTKLFKPNAVGELYLQVGADVKNKTFRQSGSANFTKTDAGWKME